MVEDEVRWRRSKGVFRNRFLFVTWNYGFRFCAARLVEFRLVSMETKLSYEVFRWQRVLSDVRD